MLVLTILTNFSEILGKIWKLITLLGQDSFTYFMEIFKSFFEISGSLENTK